MFCRRMFGHLALATQQSVWPVATDWLPGSQQVGSASGARVRLQPFVQAAQALLVDIFEHLGLARTVIIAMLDDPCCLPAGRTNSPGCPCCHYRLAGTCTAARYAMQDTLLVQKGLFDCCSGLFRPRIAADSSRQINQTDTFVPCCWRTPRLYTTKCRITASFFGSLTGHHTQHMSSAFERYT